MAWQIIKPISTLGPNIIRPHRKSIKVYKHKGKLSSNQCGTKRNDKSVWYTPTPTIGSHDMRVNLLLVWTIVGNFYDLLCIILCNIIIMRIFIVDYSVFNYLFESTKTKYSVYQPWPLSLCRCIIIFTLSNLTFTKGNFDASSIVNGL